MNIMEELKYDANGLIPAVVQEHGTGRVLMVAWMNKESLAQTLKLGEMVYWSRSRKELWHKGATSGHTQKVIDLAFDCDKDCLLAQVEQKGAACHDGYKSCFYRSIINGEVKVTEDRLVDPEKVYGKK
ncbi:MAG: Phosphoribosyl-AMP cyclohydrolase [Verrucomicrobiae bacterium]|nr:Phosphoribosyl-AMP cyclohydrolase [Verrucomicrobiae bacterium]